MATKSQRDQFLLLLSAAADLLQCKARLEQTGLGFPAAAMDELSRWILEECEARQTKVYRRFG